MILFGLIEYVLFDEMSLGELILPLFAEAAIMCASLCFCLVWLSMCCLMKCLCELILPLFAEPAIRCVTLSMCCLRKCFWVSFSLFFTRNRHGAIFETVGSLLSLLRTGDRDAYCQFFVDTMSLTQGTLLECCLPVVTIVSFCHF